MKLTVFKKAATAILLSGVLLLTACSTGDKTSKETGSNGEEIVYFKYPDNPSFDLIYLADQLGYFEGTNTRPQYVGKVAAPQIIPLVGTGDIDFGSRMVPLVISAIASGADIKVVSAGGLTLEDAPHMKYFVRKDSGIREAKDLEGKTIGFNSFGACAEFVTKKWLREQGVDVDTIEWVVVPDDKGEQTVEQGDVDLAIIHPPHSGRASNNPELTALWSDYDLDKGLGGMAPYSVNGEFARNHPEAVEDVVTAITKAANWVNENPDEARKIIAERLGMDIENVERYAYVKDLVIEEEPIQYYIDILENEGKLKEGSVDVKDVYTNEFNPFANGKTASE
ncbi:ABC transporter substrate-binding protein [Peribacillus asahii]|uniref:ABC transporter substrate-binding protein n=1 Tax=Peribacillus asahii TaxID=228899 RepID=UPI0020798285|nr:ABC transporter substrate-binding protein [Peribacillus asahii]USK58423.1 ABC transporter substrate-binding protein [Peribacillus asahii]